MSHVIAYYKFADPNSSPLLVCGIYDVQKSQAGCLPNREMEHKRQDDRFLIMGDAESYAGCLTKTADRGLKEAS